MAAPIIRKKSMLVGITLAMGITMLVNAGPTVTSDATRSQFAQTSDVVTPLSPTEKARATTWNLSDTEWRRYRSLMDGIRGSISPATLSPIEVLGIHARDEAERRRYAERWARLMREDAERILAFQHAYDQAWQRLFPAEPLIDLARLPDEKASEVAL